AGPKTGLTQHFLIVYTFLIHCFHIPARLLESAAGILLLQTLEQTKGAYLPSSPATLSPSVGGQPDSSSPTFRSALLESRTSNRYIVAAKVCRRDVAGRTGFTHGSGRPCRRFLPCLTANPGRICHAPSFWPKGRLPLLNVLCTLRLPAELSCWSQPLSPWHGATPHTLRLTSHSGIRTSPSGWAV